MTEQEALILLNMVGQIGPLRAKALLVRFSEARKIFSASLDILREVPDIGVHLARQILKAQEEIDLAGEIALCRERGYKILTVADEGYPQALKTIYDPPLVLYVWGEIKPQDELAIAMVGCRRASIYGQQIARSWAGELAGAGLTVVSGLARGIDTVSHQGALEAGGRTLAVLGSGLERMYPSENKTLAQRIATRGAVISEYSLHTPPYAGNFPRRNRLISGLSLGVVVVEAGRRSGALITANSALEQGREVFAVPGRVDSFSSEGSLSLLKQGASLAQSPLDIVEGLGLAVKFSRPHTPTAPSSSTKDFGPQVRLVYEKIGDTPRGIDELVFSTKLDTCQVLTVAFELERKGLIRQLPGKCFVRA